MLKDAAVGLLASRLFATCCGLIFVGNGLTYACFWQVDKRLVVHGASERITLPLELFVTTIWLF